MAGVPANYFNITINNLRPDDTGDIYLMLTADTTQPYTGDLPLGKNILLSDFLKDYPGGFNTEYIAGGRLYAGYGEFPSAPVPNGPQYYGWIEFSRLTTDSTVWINLTNVDMVGLPLAISGTDADGNPWSLGYKEPVTTLISQIEQQALTGTAPSTAKITCTTPKTGYTPTKIVAPDISPDSYASYDGYIAALRAASARLVITTDTPAGEEAKVFTGSFVPVPEGIDPANEPQTDLAISLTSAQGDTFQVQIGQFTSVICYQCDGGTLLYNGATVPQNQTTLPLTADEVYANSAFRNIMIGINEGYFSTTEVNYSANFPCLTPFQGNEGSVYAELVHAGSNSYGFPYADSNLKVLISASISTPVTLTIMTDTAAYGYDAKPQEGGNQPQSGQYQFGIGAGSQALGNIRIGNCTYLPTEQGAYGGFLPTLSEWTQMYFTGPEQYIWFKTSDGGAIVGSDCFDCNGIPYTGQISFVNDLLSFPANISWNPAMSSPAQPNS